VESVELTGALHQQQYLHADEGAENEDLAMGEVDKLQHAVNHGIAQGDQGIHKSQNEAF